MGIRVTVSPTPKRVNIRTVGIGYTGNTTFRELTDVDVSDADEGETLVYDAGQNKYIIRALRTVDGGAF